MARQARTYPVTLGFRAIYMPYYGPGGSIGPFHHGIDYGSPTGAEVVLNGARIALTGNSGATTGPHLHVDRRKIGAPINNRWSFKDPGRWWEIGGEVVFAGYSGSAGYVVAVQYEGDEYRFLHLSRIIAGEGQVIGDDMYKGKTAKQWHDLYQQEKKKANWRGKQVNKFRSALKSIQSTVNNVLRTK